MKNIGLYNLFNYAAIAGNVIYVLWILRNGIDEGFSGSIVQIVSYVGLLFLLMLNTVLLYRKEKTNCLPDRSPEQVRNET
jgi:hypothetical protein